MNTFWQSHYTAMMQGRLDAAQRRLATVVDRYRSYEAAQSPESRLMWLGMLRCWMAMYEDSLSNAIGFASK